MLMSADAHPGMVWAGVALFGAGIGNAVSLPPLIAQAEFAKQQTQRVAALIVAISQGCYAFAPAVFGTLRTFASGAESSTPLFAFAAAIQALAILLFALGNRSRLRNNSVQHAES